MLSCATWYNSGIDSIVWAQEKKKKELGRTWESFIVEVACELGLKDQAREEDMPCPVS